VTSVSNCIVSGDESTTPSADAGRPWPPPGADTAWWRDGDGARPRPPAVSESDTRTATETRTAAETRPRRTTNVGPDGFPDHRFRQSSRSAPTQPPHGDPAASLEDPAASLEDPAASLASQDELGEPAAEPEPAGHDEPARWEAEVGLIAILNGVETTPDDDDQTWPRDRLKAPTSRRFDSPIAVSRRRGAKNPRRPFFGLAGLLIFALLATFLAWYAAAPLWLSLGHGRAGVATVANCPVGGLNRRCADFTAADHSFTARVALLGPESMNQASGVKLDAQMVNEDASTAYAGDDASLYLRWVPSVLLMVLCGFGIAWATGASRLPQSRARWTARIASVLAPVLLLAGMLAASY
jgi:hypothetical protein